MPYNLDEQEIRDLYMWMEEVNLHQLDAIPMPAAGSAMDVEGGGLQTTLCKELDVSIHVCSYDTNHHELSFLALGHCFRQFDYYGCASIPLLVAIAIERTAYIAANEDGYGDVMSNVAWSIYDWQDVHEYESSSEEEQEQEQWEEEQAQEGESESE